MAKRNLNNKEIKSTTKKSGKGVGKSKAVSKKSTKTKPNIPKKKKWNKNKGLGLYIRVKSLLWKRYKKDNPDYVGLDYQKRDSDFFQVVHHVYEECRTAGADCPNYVVIAKYQQISKGIVRAEPFVSPNLIGRPKHFWEINDIPFETFQPYLWIVSPMILSPPGEFQVSDYLDGDGYTKHFREWVEWCNEKFDEDADFQREKGQDEESSDYGAYYELQPVTLNPENGRWEMEIYITTGSGEVTTFGYVPSGVSPTDQVLPKKVEEKKPEVEEKAPSTESESERKLREVQIREIETKTIKYKVEALNEKKKGYLAEMIAYKQADMPQQLEQILAKIEITNLQIEKITK